MFLPGTFLLAGLYCTHQRRTKKNAMSGAVHKQVVTSYVSLPYLGGQHELVVQYPVRRRIGKGRAGMCVVRPGYFSTIVRYCNGILAPPNQPTNVKKKTKLTQSKQSKIYTQKLKHPNIRRTKFFLYILAKTEKTGPETITYQYQVYIYQSTV